MSHLSAMLESIASKEPAKAAACEAIAGLAAAAASIAAVIRQPDAGAALGAIRGSANADGDDQKALDVLADEMIEAALADVPAVAAYLSEEQDDAVQLHDHGTVIVASDPLDGSSNIDTNVSVGTIFSILPAAGGVLQPGRNQLAAGFFVYGPQTTLLVSFGKAVAAFQLGDDGVFHDMGWAVTIPSDTREFAINASNMRHWQPDVAGYIADCLGGEAGHEKLISTCAGLARLLPMHGASFGAAAFFFTQLMRVRAMRLDGFGWFMKPIRWRFWLRPLVARPLTVMAIFLIWCRKRFMPACHLFLALLMKLTHLPAIGHK
jgi:fructose-1,6-bisphosphatase